LPLFGDFSFKLSISAEVTLKISASRVEQRAEIPIVSTIAMISSLIIEKKLRLRI
jgi:hypothetical protein